MRKLTKSNLRAGGSAILELAAERDSLNERLMRVQATNKKLREKLERAKAWERIYAHDSSVRACNERALQEQVYREKELAYQVRSRGVNLTDVAGNPLYVVCRDVRLAGKSADGKTVLLVLAENGLAYVEVQEAHDVVVELLKAAAES